MYVHDSPPLNSEIENIYHDSGTSKKRIATLEEGIKVKIGSFTCPAATGNYSVTGVGFKPRYVEFMVGKHSTVDVYAGMGWMDYNGDMRTISWTSAATENASHIISDKCIGIINGTASSWLVSGVYVSMNNDGFTINFVSINTSFTIGWKAVR